MKKILMLLVCFALFFASTAGATTINGVLCGDGSDNSTDQVEVSGDIRLLIDRACAIRAFAMDGHFCTMYGHIWLDIQPTVATEQRQECELCEVQRSRTLWVPVTVQ
jgi:hypothetical protein